MKKILCLLICLVLSSCSNIEFVYDDYGDEPNPLYEKTSVKITGIDSAFINSYTSTLFGNNKKETFNLFIEIEEKKTKRSIETNQATSILRYELKFLYTLRLKNGCVTYKKEILSFFSLTPKSSGYNYGTEISLEKNYELAIIDNLNQFVSILSGENIFECE